MKTPVHKVFIFALTVAALVLAALPAAAQQVTGTPGSPDATTTIDGRYLPAPPQKFEGDIQLNALQSKPAMLNRTCKILLVKRVG